MAKILLVEDDQSLSDRICMWLDSQNHQVEVLADGAEATEHLRLYQYELVILDWELPGQSGIEVLRGYRAGGGQTPVLMLTGKGAVPDKELGLDSGADDYLTKPFDPRELGARIRAILRRASTQKDNVLRVGSVALDTVSGKLRIDDVDVPLMPREYALLELLLRNPDRLFHSEELLNRVWESDSEATVYTLRQYVYQLRKKLAGHGAGKLIETVHGTGYRVKSQA